jgi:ceramide glucosyltransferase
MTILLVAVCVVAIAYQLFALAATLLFLKHRDPEPGFAPPVSILKPIHGSEPGFGEAIGAHTRLDYPVYELLFGVASLDDPALPEIRALGAGKIVPGRVSTPNGKVGRLIDMVAEARHEILLVNDSDIRVEPDYLRRVVAPLADPSVGVVTCLYRARAAHWPAIFEAIGIATDFAPGTLVAPYAGVREFGLGSTLVFRRADLAAAGGFRAFADFIADDYQLASRISRLGKRVHLSKTIVETTLQGRTWRAVWAHQLRWHRTIRVSRRAYTGLFVTHASTWALIAAAAGLWTLATATLAARYAMALTAGVAAMRCPLTARYWWLVPVRDLFGSAVWAAGMFGNTVEWRGAVLRLDRDGRIL